MICRPVLVWNELVLEKVIEVAKEISPGDKKRVKTGVKTPINRRSGWGPGGCLPFWVPKRQGGRAAPPGLVVLSVAARALGRWSAGDVCGGQCSGGDLLRQFGGI